MFDVSDFVQPELISYIITIIVTIATSFFIVIRIVTHDFDSIVQNKINELLEPIQDNINNLLNPLEKDISTINDSITKLGGDLSSIESRFQSLSFEQARELYSFYDKSIASALEKYLLVFQNDVIRDNLLADSSKAKDHILIQIGIIIRKNRERLSKFKIFNGQSLESLINDVNPESMVMEDVKNDLDLLIESLKDDNKEKTNMEFNYITSKIRENSQEKFLARLKDIYVP